MVLAADISYRPRAARLTLKRICLNLILAIGIIMDIKHQRQVNL